MKKYILPAITIVMFGAVIMFGLLANNNQDNQSSDVTSSESIVSTESFDAKQKEEELANKNEAEKPNYDESKIEEENVTKFIVKDKNQLLDELENPNIIEKQEITDTNSVAITFKDSKSAEEFATLATEKVGATAIEEDVKMELFAAYNDTYYGSQKNLTQMSMANAWPYYAGSTSTVIAIIDTGVRGTHEDLSGKVLAGYNFITGAAISANSNSDDNGHGTAMASAAASIANNSKGIVGIAYNAKILPVKAFNSSGTGNSSAIANGVRWAANSGAKVINMSFGSSTYSSTLHDAIQYARNKGCIVLSASGNDGGAVAYPGRDSLVIGVGSVNASNQRSSFSGYGNELDVVAPGEYIYTASFSGDSSYTRVSGTSVSTAQASGLAALSLGWHSAAGIGNNMNYIVSSSTKVAGMGGANYTPYYGYGVINYNRLQTKVGDFKHTYVGQNGYPTLSTNSSYNFILRVKNTGGSTWRTDIVRLGTSRGHDRISGFLREGGDPSGWLSANRIKMSTSTVAPGSIATYSFYMKNGTVSPGNYREYFQLVADGVGWMEDYGIYWNITVPQPTPSYSYSYVSQNSYPTLTAGGSGYKFMIRAKNTGTKTWTQNVVRLGTSRGHDRISGFLREGGDPSGWLSANRIKMKETSVAPGATATFEFYMKAPSGMPSGTYREYFQLVADGVGWMQDYGIYWDVKVR